MMVRKRTRRKERRTKLKEGVVCEKNVKGEIGNEITEPINAEIKRATKNQVRTHS